MSIMQCSKCEEMVDTDQEDYDFETLRCERCIMDFEELVEKIKRVCVARTMNKMNDDDIEGVLEGGCGQYDDTFYMGIDEGEANLAIAILTLIAVEMEP